MVVRGGLWWPNCSVQMHERVIIFANRAVSHTMVNMGWNWCHRKCFGRCVFKWLIMFCGVMTGSLVALYCARKKGDEGRVLKMVR